MFTEIILTLIQKPNHQVIIYGKAIIFKFPDINGTTSTMKKNIQI